MLTLFGVLPAAMAWQRRGAGSQPPEVRLVPGGRGVLLCIGGVAAAIIANELAGTL